MFKLKINYIESITLQTKDSEKFGSKIYGIKFHLSNKEDGLLNYQMFTLTHVIWDEENKEFIERETKNMNRYEQAKEQLLKNRVIEWSNHD
jgi:hypothetical protein